MELQLITSIRPLTAEELSILYHWWPAIKAVGMFAFVGGLSYYIKRENIETTKPFYVPAENGEFLTLLGMAPARSEHVSVRP